MNTIKTISILLIILFSSCKSSITVYSGYNKSVDFSQYKTYSFLKFKIDRLQTSSLNKKKILQDREKILEVIETELGKKGMIKSEKSDLLVFFSTKERKKYDKSTTYNGNRIYGWGFPYQGSTYEYPYPYSSPDFANNTREGVLFVYFVDTKKNELIWQGNGIGNLPHSQYKKESFINDLVKKILMKYPPL